MEKIVRWRKVTPLIGKRDAARNCPDYTDCDVGCVSNITKQYDSSERRAK